MPSIRIPILILACGFLLGAFPAAADDTDVRLVIREHKFVPAEITVPAGKRIKLVIDNQDATAEEFESHDLRIEKVIPAGKALRLRMPALKKGTYNFVGDFNQSTANGRIIAE